MTSTPTTDADRTFTAERIRKARERHLGMTQRELAIALEVEQVSVSRWERGVAEPKTRYVRAIADLAELPVKWFHPPDDAEAIA